MLKWSFTLALGLASILTTTASAAPPPKDTRLFELRIYTAPEGKLDALHARFRDHTLKLFEKHGMMNIGYWTPIENPDRKLYYIISHKDKAARDASFKAFGEDPAWKKAYTESEKDGKLVSKVEVHFMTLTDYSPEVIVGKTKKERVFELRTYIATPGHLPNLNDRFKDHTIKLFEKYGMINYAYWNLTQGLKQPHDDVTLIYLLTHESVEAGKKSFEAFRKDPDWLAARTASEKKAGGSLTIEKGGVVSLYMKPTDYSPTK